MIGVGGKASPGRPATIALVVAVGLVLIVSGVMAVRIGSSFASAASDHMRGDATLGALLCLPLWVAAGVGLVVGWRALAGRGSPALLGGWILVLGVTAGWLLLTLPWLSVVAVLLVAAAIATAVLLLTSDEGHPRIGALDRGAAVILATMGALILGALAIDLGPHLSALADPDPHLAGDVWMTVLFAGVPGTVGGLLALLAGWLVWQGRVGGRAFALIWIALAMLVAWQILATSGGGRLWGPFPTIVWSVLLGGPIAGASLIAGWARGRSRAIAA